MFKKFLEYFYSYLLALTLFGIVFSVSLQVFFRYVLNSPLIWTDEMSRLSFCWFTFTGSALATLENKHLEVNFFYNKFSVKSKLAVNIFSNIIILIFTIILLIYSMLQIISLHGVRSASTRMPLVFFAIPIFLGFAGIAYFTLNRLINIRKEENNA